MHDVYAGERPAARRGLFICWLVGSNRGGWMDVCVRVKSMSVCVSVCMCICVYV